MFSFAYVLLPASWKTESIGMGVIKLYGFHISPPVRTVQLTAKALGLDLEFHTVNVLNEEHLTDEFKKLNPQHTVPVINDDGFVVIDSHAIAIYLVSKYAPNSGLYPSDIKQQARINSILHFESGVLFPRLRWIGESLLEACEWADVPQERIDYALKSVELLEALLGDDPYMAGGHVTLADISCVTSFSSLEHMLKIERNNYPKVYAWYERMKQIDGFEEFVKKIVDQLDGVIQGVFESNKEKRSSGNLLN
ncbi:glutathione S-transferase 1-like [Armigeres subalbatus]|uniref:glutathione S-transferase 1-like n=1 Tax=Armigeres subalbatus TaxID=124917 RepID=UPI002ED0009E